MSRLQGKVAFITGVARGQGRAHAVRLAKEGADIIGVDIADTLPGVPYVSATVADLDETAELVRAEGRTALFGRIDVRDHDGMAAFLMNSVAELGGLDIVVANAGICVPATWRETTPQIFKDTMDINVTGVWNTVTVSAPHLVERGGGSIVLISSAAGLKMQPFMVHYTASKHAVTGMTRAFAAELGAHNIRVNSVHPGAVMSPMGSGDMRERIADTAASYPRLAAMGTSMLNDKWAADCDEIANAVAFLASDESSFVTAEHLAIDGGSSKF